MGQAERFLAFEKKLKSLKAGEIMTRNIISVKKEMSLAEFSEMILQKKISGAPVVDDRGKVIGVITATDLFVIMQMLRTGRMEEDGKKGVYNPTVEFGMSKDVLSVKKDTSLAEVMDIMTGRNIHTLPVMEGGNLLGVIGRHDVLKHFYSIVKDL